MPTVGRVLAAERVRQGLDLKDISRITKLGTRALLAIESDEFDQLPGIMFARNFVRQYAEALNLDPALAIEQFDREQSRPAPAFAPLHHTPEIHVPRLNSKSFVSAVLDSNAISAFFTFLLTLIICAAAFYGYQYWRVRSAAPSAHQTVHPTKAARPVRDGRAPTGVPPAAVATETAAVTPAAAPAVAAAAPALASPLAESAGAHVHATISATEPCWTRVTADSKVVFEGVLAAGDSRSITAAASIIVRAGNSGALAIQLNGKDVPPFGPKGQVRTVVLTPLGSQVRTPTPEALVDF